MDAETLDLLVAQYVELRDKKSKITAKAKELVGTLDDKMSKLETDILQKLNAIGVESVRTKAGTAYKKTTRSTTVGSWDDFLPWVKATDSWHMLNRAANKTAVLEYLDEAEELPPGINLFSKIEVSINRPAKR